MADLRSKRNSLKSLFLLLFLFAVFVDNAKNQTVPNPATKLDPYRNFVGEWEGVIKELGQVDSKVKLKVFEEKNGNRMAWQFEYGERGQKGYHTNTKWFALNPVKEVMSTHWDGEAKRSFKTDGLSYFTEKGYGAFSALEISRLYPNTFRCTFELDEGTLRYLWEQSDGHSFRPFSVTQLSRIANKQ